MKAILRVDPGRVRFLREGEPGAGPVLYWMRRDQRVRDNWALLYAQERAVAAGKPLGVVFCLAQDSPGAAARQHRFTLANLRAMAGDLARLRVAFFLATGDPAREVAALMERCAVGCLVTDYDPRRISRMQESDVCERVAVPVVQVDAHNIVPAWLASTKAEYAARTLRPKLHGLLPRFLTDLPAMKEHPYRWPNGVEANAGMRAAKQLELRGCANHDSWCKSGEAAAHAALDRFLSERLAVYHTDRNDPNKEGQSDLSPYLHFGQLSPQRAAFTAMQSAAAGRDAFLEELIVRRELSDNFCHYNHAYDRFEGLPDWGRRTLEDHGDDPREHCYDMGTFEAAATHEPLWNAAQTELVVRGKMHGYLRMYWAKKILEWTRDPAEALQIAMTLNDRYSLDGNDPNGYAGCAWSIGGLHDRPWFERPVFGKIRYMNLAGCKRKFRVERYIDRMQQLARGAGS